jgi:threonine dehydratase
MVSELGPSAEQIAAAVDRIAGFAVRTPLMLSPELSRLTGSEIFYKPECLQPSGSFKIRGAANKLKSLTTKELARGVVTFSTGNHGCAVAWAASRLGSQASVFVSELVPAEKLAALKAHGADLVVIGADQDEAEAAARQRCDETEAVMIHPFDDVDVIAGQATIGVEILEDCPAPETVIVPVGGGGLIAGVSTALAQGGTGIRVIGATIDAEAAMLESVRAGHPVAVHEASTLADSLGGGIGANNAHTLRLVQTHVRDIVQVSEGEIARAMEVGLSELGLVLEGGAAVPVAAVISGHVNVGDGPVVLVLSGRRVDPARIFNLVHASKS